MQMKFETRHDLAFTSPFMQRMYKVPSLCIVIICTILLMNSSDKEAVQQRNLIPSSKTKKEWKELHSGHQVVPATVTFHCTINLKFKIQ